MLNEKDTATKELDIDAVIAINKHIEKQRKAEKKERVHESLKNELDIRDKFLGITELRKPYQPVPYIFKTREGKRVNYQNRAEAAAKRLAEIWSDTAEPSDTTGSKIVEENLGINTSDITMKELLSIIKKFKRRKAPGPDEIPMEVFKEMNRANLEEVLNILNQWWNEEEIPEEELQARVVWIFKNKGSTSDVENYRPISLTNSIYKIFTAILKKRIAEK